MADTKLVSSFRTAGSMGKPASLPPKSPFPSIPPSYGEYHPMGPRGVAKQREGHRHHQRTSSESFLIEEQPSWLDELLDEPETPVRRGGHRRSSSDSFAYLDPANGFSSFDSIAVEECKGRNLASQSSWGSREFDQVKDVQRSAYFRDVDSFGGPRNRGWEPAFNMAAYPNSLPSPKDSMSHSREFDGLTAKVVEKREHEISAQDPKCLVERREGSYAKHSQSETDSKRVKQQFAQRSRVRKLQYIAELETHVQTLQAERVEVSAELEFLDQQNLILNLENKALKQRLDSLQQEHLIKHLQHEMLEREIARLKSIHQQQQQTPIHVRSSSSSRELDLDMKFANLTLKHKEANSTRI